MSDPGLPSALGIESVEWFAQEGGGDNLMVRVTGRWRRRPATTGQPMLVIEVHGYRHRYPAMPDPPSLSGTAPGTWRISFSVPAWTAPYLGTRATLQLGGVTVRLPAQLEHVREPVAAEAPAAFDRHDLESALANARRRAREAENSALELSGRLRALEHELAAARAEPDQLRALLDDQERGRLAAEQRAFAEQRLREDAQDALARRERELHEELSEAQVRIAELETELDALQRRLDETEHHAEAALALWRRLEASAVMWGTRAELALAIRTPGAPVREVGGFLLEPRGLKLERLAMAPRMGLAPARGGVPPEVGGEVADRLTTMHEQLDQLRGIVERERAGQERAMVRAANLEHELEQHVARSERAYDALEELRGQLDGIRSEAAAEEAGAPGAEVSGSGAVAGPLDAARLEAARARLRGAVPPALPELGEPVQALRPWLLAALRRMLDRDPAMAGRLVLALLPAQRLVHPLPLAYDLVLWESECVQVTVAGDYWSVEQAESARPEDAVQFRVEGDLASLARLVAARRIRRRGGRRRARVSGDRTAAQALLALVRVPLSLGELIAAGVAAEPGLALSLAAAAVEPGWTRGERFAIAYREPDASVARSVLRAADGARLTVDDGEPSESLDAVITCPPESLLALLGGATVAGAEVGPDERPLELIQNWMKRAQSG